jgi:hypothetical protein
MGFSVRRAPPRACLSFIGLLYAHPCAHQRPPRSSGSTVPSIHLERETNDTFSFYSHDHRVPDSPTPSPLPVSAQLLCNSECVCAYGNRNRERFAHACVCVCAVSQAVQSVSCSAPARPSAFRCSSRSSKLTHTHSINKTPLVAPPGTHTGVLY